MRTLPISSLPIGQTLAISMLLIFLAVLGVQAIENDPLQEKGEVAPARFVARSNGTVIDRKTHLMWMKNANCWDRISWAQAKRKIASLNKGKIECQGYQDDYNNWRLPSRDELASLIDFEQEFPILADENTFVNVNYSWYWTNTTSSHTQDEAWLVPLDYGPMYTHALDGEFFVWPVRSTPGH